MRVGKRVEWTLFNIMPRLQHHRAQRSLVGVRSAAVVHRDAKESGIAKCLTPGIALFQMPAKGLLAFVNAADDLKVRRSIRTRSLLPRAPIMHVHGVERLIAVSPF